MRFSSFCAPLWPSEFCLLNQILQIGDIRPDGVSFTRGRSRRSSRRTDTSTPSCRSGNCSGSNLPSGENPTASRTGARRERESRRSGSRPVPGRRRLRGRVRSGRRCRAGAGGRRPCGAFRPRRTPERSQEIRAAIRKKSNSRPIIVPLRGMITERGAAFRSPIPVI